MKVYVFMAMLALLQVTTSAATSWALFDTRHAGLDVSYRYHFYNDQLLSESWHKETYVANNKNVDYFRTCVENWSGLEEDKRENWLLMPKIGISPATEITLEVGFAIERCETSDVHEKACQREVLLRAYPLPITQFLPEKDWHNRSRWVDIGTLSAISPRDEVDTHMHIQVFKYTPTDTAVYFGFQDRGACLTLHYLKVLSNAPPLLLANDTENVVESSDWFTWENIKGYGPFILICLLLLILAVGLIILCIVLCSKKKETDPEQTRPNLHSVEAGISHPYGYGAHYSGPPLPLNIERGITTLGTSFAMQDPDNDDQPTTDSTERRPGY